jgi:uncharacterized membrane-anchored protein YhcB (DUF1043 family)
MAVAVTLAYAVMVVLGWLMHRYVKRNLHGANNTQKKVLEMQRQLTLALIIQVDLFPFFNYSKICHSF